MKDLKFAVVNVEESHIQPYPYVYVEESGEYRELFNGEKVFLEDEYHIADCCRPYVKFRYYQKIPDGKYCGYCKRTKVPKGLRPGELPPPKRWWEFWK